MYFHIEHQKVKKRKQKTAVLLKIDDLQQQNFFNFLLATYISHSKFTTITAPIISEVFFLMSLLSRRPKWCSG
jgi:hypothetical protein